ncbi:uncharacterized protein LOC123292188 [Chrysoperla carnea]|uniref:uncharacterized protein LOC123292188 n=1 Tax=Chrysoperla carnea TaxID=189513 RepID=UPI001D087D54|nr:uncharacterized protein LOC123292188 [Chrysoperla carnea]
MPPKKDNKMDEDVANVISELQNQLVKMRVELDLLQSSQSTPRVQTESQQGESIDILHSIIQHSPESSKTIPNFDPQSTTGLTPKQWIDVVENVSKMFKWNDTFTILQASSKLKEAAKYWFDTVRTTINSWKDFKKEFIASFPTVIAETDTDEDIRNIRTAEAVSDAATGQQ